MMEGLGREDVYEGRHRARQWRQWVVKMEEDGFVREEKRIYGDVGVAFGNTKETFQVTGIKKYCDGVG